MVKGANGATLVSKQRLQLFKELQDIFNAATFLGINANAVSATKLQTARTIDGESFDGTANITLPTKVVQIWSATVNDTKTYYTEAAKTNVISTFDTAKLYIDMTTNEHLHYNGTQLVAAAAADNVERIPMSYKGAANGVAELDSNGLVPATQLPSYVDDVLEIVVETTGEPAVTKYYLRTEAGAKGDEITASNGEKGKIYFDPDATIDGCYRWSGSAMVAIGTKVSTADRAINDKDGHDITTTYVKVEAGKDLMTDTQATQLATLVDEHYDVITEAEVKALFDSTTVSAWEAAQTQP